MPGRGKRPKSNVIPFRNVRKAREVDGRKLSVSIGPTDIYIDEETNEYVMVFDDGTEIRGPVESDEDG